MAVVGLTAVMVPSEAVTMLTMEAIRVVVLK